jgi:catechol 2,3-dioxygenase-like lactoylglutathione lyase family enzyme
MYDTIQNDQFPPGAAAYAAYVDGNLGNQPNYAHIVAAFPKAQHLSVALFSGDNADALDVEPGASSPADVPAWYAAQRKRGIQRPCVYASASTMNSEILPVLTQAGIARDAVRLWTAHYDVGEHICGPGTCGALSVNADGTQWTPNAVVNGVALDLDQSLLLENFFTTDPTVTTEAELQSGQLNLGKNAHTVIAVPPGTAQHIAFGVDNGVQGLPPARLRVAIFSTGPGWHVSNVFVDGAKGLTTVAFPDPSKTGVISINRGDAGTTAMGYVIY